MPLARIPHPEDVQVAKSTITHESKAKFLEAAMRVIRTKGYTATRIEDICEAAGLTKGSFFHHFETKEELALQAADHFAAMADRLFAAAPYRSESDPLDRVLGYVDFRRAILQGDLPEFTCLLGTMVQEVMTPTRGSGRRASEISAPTPAPWESLALFTQAVIQGAFVLAKAKQSPEVAAESLQHLRRYLETQFHAGTQTQKV